MFFVNFIINPTESVIYKKTYKTIFMIVNKLFKIYYNISYY